MPRTADGGLLRGYTSTLAGSGRMSSVSVPRTADGGLLQIEVHTRNDGVIFTFQCRERLMGDCYWRAIDRRVRIVISFSAANG